MILRILFLVLPFGLLGQSEESPYTDKVRDIDVTIETLYNVISGDAGVKRDWDLFRYLFTSDAKLIPIRKNKEGKSVASYLSPDDYISNSGSWLVENGFIEKEIFRVTENFGSLTHVFSTYEAYKSSKDAKPFMRGINSIQIMYDGDRYWIVNISWEAESKDNLLPDKYIGEGR
jgi:hypothetical protein